jgi:hypothetical protein
MSERARRRLHEHLVDFAPLVLALLGVGAILWYFG